MHPRNAACIQRCPQIAEAIFINSTELVAGQARRIALVEDCEAQSIKAHQPVKRRKPHITVTRLQSAVHRVLRQAVVSRPVIEAVLRVRGLAANQKDEAEKKTCGKAIRYQELAVKVQGRQRSTQTPDSHYGRPTRRKDSA